MLIALAGQYDANVLQQLRVRHQVLDLCEENAAAWRAEVLVTRGNLTVDAAVLDGFPKLRLIIKAGSGLDNIDLDAAASRRVTVRRTAGSATSVAELTFALLFAVLRNIPQFDAAVRRGDWTCKSLFHGGLTNGRRLGLVGLGEIGRETARIGAALGMKVSVFDRSPGQSEKAALIGELGLTVCPSIDDLVRSIDVLSLHIPHQDGDPPLIGPQLLASLPPGAIIINTARASLLDQSALLEGLRSRRIAGAGLDVHPNEGGGCDDPLRNLVNVVLTPHVGAQSKEAMAEIGRRVVAFVDEFEHEQEKVERCTS